MTYETESILRLRRTWLFVASCLWMVLGLGLVAGAVIGAGRVMPITASVLAVLAYMGGVAGSMRAWQKWWAVRRGKLTADEEGVRVDGRLVVRRSAVSRAYPLELDGRHVVRLVRRGMLVRSIDIDVGDEHEARKLLAAMRLDGASSVTEWRLQDGTTRTRRVHIGATLAVFAMMLTSAAFFAFVAPVAPGTFPAMRVAAFVLYILANGGLAFSLEALVVHLSVGADGIRLRQLTGKRFIPYGEIEKVTRDGGNITLALKNGIPVAIHHPDEGKANLLSDREDEAKKLVERIEEQLAAHRAAPKANVDVLTRAGRRAEQWLRDARALTERNATFRTPAVPHEELWRIVEDAAAEPTARAGAAVALQRDLDDAARSRLRVAAAACAAPQLRVALESVADNQGKEEDEADLLRALDPLEDLRMSRR